MFGVAIRARAAVPPYQRLSPFHAKHLMETISFDDHDESEVFEGRRTPHEGKLQERIQFILQLYLRNSGRRDPTTAKVTLYRGREYD